jgi:hypothetical protein
MRRLRHHENESAPRNDSNLSSVIPGRSDRTEPGISRVPDAQLRI